MYAESNENSSKRSVHIAYIGLTNLIHVYPPNIPYYPVRYYVCTQCGKIFQKVSKCKKD